MNQRNRKESPRNSHEGGVSRRTDESVTPPHGDPDRRHVAPETDLSREPEVADPKNPAGKPQGTTEDQIANMESEGPGPAEGRTDNKAGG